MQPLSSLVLCHSLQEHAFESSQKYKEGKFIIELAHMIKDNGWDWGASSRVTNAAEEKEGNRGTGWRDWVEGWEGGSGVVCGGWVCDFGLADLPLTFVTYYPSLPITPLDVHTQNHTRQGPRHPSLPERRTRQVCTQLAGLGDWPATVNKARFFFWNMIFVAFKKTAAHPLYLLGDVSTVWSILPCLIITLSNVNGNLARARPVGPACRGSVALNEELTGVHSVLGVKEMT